MIFQFSGRHYFNFSMYEVSSRFARLDGAEVKVEAEVMDAFLMLNHTGFSYSKIINSSINCRFIGTPPFVFKPGMPFHGTVSSRIIYLLFEILFFNNKGEAIRKNNN